ncbi:MAG: electron transfer flavoprotein subunit alpha/FixB family protein [Actinobacteria bacterium]|nr:electron transfer flavoprotein subunit alpha/FixB family protein [Actinomycetota bacterium]
MIAVVVVRAGVLPTGGAEVVAECAGRAVLVGSQVAVAAESLRGVATALTLVEQEAFRPAAIAHLLAPLLIDEPIVVLPASPDGRDLAPRIAFTLHRPLHAGATLVNANHVDMARGGGRELHRLVPGATFVATLQPGTRGVVPDPLLPAPTITSVTGPTSDGDTRDAVVMAVDEADPATIDLGEATRIIAGGGGLDGSDRMRQLADIAAAIGASVGATRVVTDRGWAPHERQIGTTGVVVAPRLYMAFGVAGAVQHTSGLGDPTHIVSVNTDPHCPMMQLADLAIVGDANATIDELERLLT